VPGILPNDGPWSSAVDEALTALIDRHLSENGLSLTVDQKRRIRQQGPVHQFLNAILDVARREQSGQEQTINLTGIATVLSGSRTALAEYRLWQPPNIDVPDLQVPKLEFRPPMTNPKLPDGPKKAPDAAQPKPQPAQKATPTKPTAESGASTSAAPTAPASAPTAAAPAPVPAVAPPPPAEPALRIRLPNATAGTPYTHVLAFDKTPALEGFRVVRMDGIEGTGMSFDLDMGRIHGAPTTDPKKTHEVTFSARLEKAAGDKTQHRDATFVLLVNPNPRALWNKVDPDPSLPFQKPHQRSAALSGPLRAVASSVRGRSHANNGTFREDDFHFEYDATGQWLVLAVSDGAGSAKLSRRGSELVSQASVSSLVQALPGIDAQLANALPEDQAGTVPAEACQAALDSVFLEPVGRAAFNASRAVQAEAKSLQVEEKALSATLLLAAVRQYGGGLLVASYWIGDGAAAVFDPERGALQLLGDADSGEFSGQTRFLQSSEFGSDPWVSIKKRFRCTWRPSGAFLVFMTDGVSDPKFGTDNALKDPTRWLAWWRNDLCTGVNLSRDHDATPVELESYLDFWSQGEHDDRTLALVY